MPEGPAGVVPRPFASSALAIEIPVKKAEGLVDAEFVKRELNDKEGERLLSVPEVEIHNAYKETGEDSKYVFVLNERVERGELDSIIGDIKGRLREDRIGVRGADLHHGVFIRGE
jgi:hypothetical protein